jgi:hypothetical protein
MRLRSLVPVTTRASNAFRKTTARRAFEMIRGSHRDASIRSALIIASHRVETASINANPLTTNAALAMTIRCGEMMSITASLLLDANRNHSQRSGLSRLTFPRGWDSRSGRTTVIILLNPRVGQML